jgi:NADPH:quinone reductase-like Zn-dependent oxidoreductase
MQAKKMKAISLPAYQGNIIRALRGLELIEKSLPRIEDDEVLIEIDAAPCNPSDIAFIQGGYNVKKALPAIPGFEGTGKAVHTGASAEASKLLSKRLSFFSQSERSGSWATHAIVKANDCIEIRDEMAGDQAACFSVNPFTAYAMVELAKKSGTKGIIQNAAAGQLGKFIHILAEREGITVINIVRKKEHVGLLKNAGFNYVLCQLDEDFQSSLTELAHKFDARIAFDAVGGELSGQIMKAMPSDSKLFLYGALGARTLSEIPASDVIFNNKSLHGFNMNEWKDHLSREEFLIISDHLQKLFIDGILHTEIQGRFPLEDHGAALMQYIRNMSGGKVLFVTG